ncbi:MAG: hypothetical protein ACLFV7_07090 [Phycisphaerae bacterium]
MIVEHTFVTTVEDEEALARARDYCREAGFLVDRNGQSLTCTRGRKRHQAVRKTKFEQSLQLDCDRGRVTIVAGLQPPGGRESSKQGDCLLALVRGLQTCVDDGVVPSQAVLDYRGFERKGGTLKWLLIFLGILLGLAAIIAIAST